MATRLLIVDDEVPLLRNLSSYLGSFSAEFEVVTATSAEEALEVLKSDVDVLLTDIRLPGLDGIELVRRATAAKPGIGVLVMTAFPSSDVRRSAAAAGALRHMEKPLDVRELRRTLLEVVRSRSGWSGSVGGLDIFDFTQLYLMSGKSTAIRVEHGSDHGVLVFKDRSLVHASTHDLEGDEAFYRLATWEGGTCSEIPDLAGYPPNIRSSTNHLMIEAARLRDEARRDLRSELNDDGDITFEPEVDARVVPTGDVPTTEPAKEEPGMALKDHLTDFEDIEGFKGIAVFTAQGEMLEGIAKGKTDIKTVGMFANNALLNAQKATDQMGVGRGNLMQIRAPQAIVIMRCLNEATDFAATKEGKAHFHTVVVLDPEGNTGMASMLLDKAVAKIADEVR